MKSALKIALFLTSFSFTAISLHSAEPLSAQQRIEAAVQEFSKKQPAGGVAIAVIYGGGEGGYRREVYTAGHTKGPASPAPDEKTTFYLGSVTKVLTSTVLCKFIEEGKLSLKDPAQKFVPKWVHVPKYDGVEITLENLATHTAGLPRDAGGVKRPYHYEENDFYNWLNHLSLRSKPGTKDVYSNVGFGFLGLILANVAGKSYEEVIIENLCQPLGMPNTRIRFTKEMEDNRPDFFDPRGKFVKASCCSTLPALGGGGAFASNLDDMSRFLAYNMGLLGTGIDSLLPMLREHRFTLGGNNFQCLGWYNNPLYKGGSVMIFSKNGAIDGASSFIAYVKESSTGVVVLANSNSGVVGLGKEILRVLNPETGIQKKPSP